ncbi:uncharacterized protein N7458_003098 [Penicillium daleae]|uniref:Uncharacterized protein n=1 Tax=Penicillium daleae TaxID=63821 RepID=A0AAD6CET9_9EURO|nr:uncharacterized protein N7458_003098 [Penicillium daleae]KAJ5461546.1 hypothetical protein N7458_003098 [Penicillium daleae]
MQRYEVGKWKYMPRAKALYRHRRDHVICFLWKNFHERDSMEEYSSWISVETYGSLEAILVVYE